MSLTNVFKSSGWQTRVLIFVLAFVCPILLASEPPDCDFRRLSKYHDEAVLFKQQNLYSGQPYLHLVNNRPFVENVYRADERDQMLYMHVENAVLKSLNDKIFIDKEVSAASLNLYKTIFFEKLQHSHVADYLVAVELGGCYSCYKTNRLKFDARTVDNRWLVGELDKLRQSADAEFSKRMREYPTLAKAYETSSNPRITSPRKWHEVGLGYTPEKASLKARLRRYSSDSDILFGPADEAQLARDLRLVEMDREALAKVFSGSELFHQGLPSEALVDILRFAQTAENVLTQADYRKHVRDALGRRFGITPVQDDVIDRLQRYYNLANKLAPSVLTPFQEPIELADLSRADHGVWAWDISGQNMRNMTGVFYAIHFAAKTAEAEKYADSELVNVALEETGMRQQRESEAFWGFRQDLQSALARHSVIPLDDPSRLQSVGDESTALPHQFVLPTQKAKVLTDLAQNPQYGGLYRSTLQEQTYLDGSPLPRAERFELIAQGEKLEKTLRKKMEGSAMSGLFPYHDLREVLISVRITPLDKGTARIDVDIARSQKLDNEERYGAVLQRIRDELPKELPEGWRVGRVQTVEQTLDERSRRAEKPAYSEGVPTEN